MRKDFVQQVPNLANFGYEPSMTVFGQIEDLKPWWGLYGMYFYGNGPKSIEGPSKESRFLCNPYLLVGVAETNAWVSGTEPDAEEQFYPVPTSLTWMSDRSSAEVFYNVTSFFNFLTSHQYNGYGDREVMFVAYNARDFGFNFLYLDPNQSRNVEMVENTGKPVQIRQMLHCGQSCGYPGGCNNMSPEQKEINCRVQTVPATAVLKLWKIQPQSPQIPADMIYTIKLE